MSDYVAVVCRTGSRRRDRSFVVHAVMVHLGVVLCLRDLWCLANTRGNCEMRAQRGDEKNASLTKQERKSQRQHYHKPLQHCTVAHVGHTRIYLMGEENIARRQP